MQEGLKTLELQVQPCSPSPPCRDSLHLELLQVPMCPPEGAPAPHPHTCWAALGPYAGIHCSAGSEQIGPGLSQVGPLKAPPTT